MGGKFWFFTDPALLGAQAAADAYGPQPAAGGNDLFRITHRHPATATGAPAVAICDGALCAQDDGSGGLTLILKPSQAPPFEAPVVSYFIYKGIDRASLLNGDAVLDETDSTANDLTKRVAATWKALNAGALAGSEAGLGLDRDGAFLHDQDVSTSKVFTDADPIERLFTYPHPTIQLPVVSAGDVIGSFGSACGLEVVLLRLGYRPKLGFARSADNLIAVPSLAGGPRPADDAEWFAHWHAKEQALAFMDPAAYFGAFVQAKLNKKSGTSTSKVKGSEVYDELLATFANRNVAWLDIRNNYSYSYNLFGLYEGPLRFVSRSDASQANELDFRSGGWPLLKLEVANVPGGRRGSLHRSLLRLPAGLSAAPAVLLSKGFAKRLGPERHSLKTPKVAVDSDEPALLSPIRIAFPAKGAGSQDVLTASYTRINLYEMAGGNSQAAALDVAGGHYLDGLFRLSDLRFDRDYAGHALRFEIFPEEVLVDLSAYAGPSYAAAVGIALDSQHMVLFAYPLAFVPNDHESGQPRALASLATRFEHSSLGFEQWLKTTFAATQFSKATIAAGLATQLDLVVTREQLPRTRDKLTGVGNVNDYCFVILGIADHTAMVAAIDAGAAVNSGPVFSRVAHSANNIDAASSTSYLENNLRATTYRQGVPANKVAQFDLAWASTVSEYAHT